MKRKNKARYAFPLTLTTVGLLALTACSSSSVFTFESKKFGPAETITVTFPEDVLEASEHPLLMQSVTMTGMGETSNLCRVDFEFEYHEGVIEVLSASEFTEEDAARVSGGSTIRFYEALLKEAVSNLDRIKAAPDDYPVLRAAIEETKALYKNGEYVDEWSAIVQPATPEIEQVFLEAHAVKSFGEFVESGPEAVSYLVMAYTPDEQSAVANERVNPTRYKDISGGLPSYIDQVVEAITRGAAAEVKVAAEVPVETRAANRLSLPDGAPMDSLDEDAPIEGSYLSEDLTQAVVIMGCSDFGDDKKPRLDGPTHELKFKMLKDDGKSVVWDSTQLEFMTDPEGNVAITKAHVGFSLDSVIEGWPDKTLQ